MGGALFCERVPPVHPIPASWVECGPVAARADDAACMSGAARAGRGPVTVCVLAILALNARGLTYLEYDIVIMIIRGCQAKYWSRMSMSTRSRSRSTGRSR